MLFFVPPPITIELIEDIIMKQFRLGLKHQTCDTQLMHLPQSELLLNYFPNDTVFTGPFYHGFTVYFLPLWGGGTLEGSGAKIFLSPHVFQ